MKNLSGDPAQDYLADTGTDDLITELARIPNLRVVSWSSVMQEKDARKSLQSIAAELHADVLVEGSVARTGDTVRINVRMIDTRTENHLWSGTIQGHVDSLLALEDQAAREIAAHTRLPLAPALLRTQPSLPPAGAAAHDAYLRGRNYFDKRQPDASVREFQRAIDLDPGYAAAYAGLSAALQSELLLQPLPLQQVIPLASAAAEKALQLDPENGDAFIARGALEVQFLWQWDAALRDLTRGVALSPSNSYGRMLLALYYDTMGDAGEAVNQMQQAVAIDPLSFLMSRHYGSTLFYARRYDEALSRLQYTRQMYPASAGVVDRWIADIFEQKRMFNDSIHAQLLQLSDDHDPDLGQLREAYRRGGWTAFWQLRVQQLAAAGSPDPCAHYELGLAALRAGDKTLAFTQLTAAADQHCYWIMMTSVDPTLDPLRSDPRFARILAPLHLPPSPR